jgi:hypothetical protein
MKLNNVFLAGVVLSQLILTGVQAEEPKRTAGPGVTNSVPDDSDAPNAVLISIAGKCEYSEDGVRFTDLTSKQTFVIPTIRPGGPPGKESSSPFVFSQGAVLRTGADSHIDVFFRRIGTTVRLQPDTEIKLEKMERQMKDGVPVMNTLLALRTGRIFTVVRSLVPGSTLEIRNAAGRSVVEGGGGKGRYIITADGTHVTEKGSVIPLKVIGETGVTIIEPGMKYSAKDGKVFPLESPESVKFLIDFDELDSQAEQFFPREEAAGKKY